MGIRIVPRQALDIAVADYRIIHFLGQGLAVLSAIQDIGLRSAVIDDIVNDRAAGVALVIRVAVIVVGKQVADYGNVAGTFADQHGFGMRLAVIMVGIMQCFGEDAVADRQVAGVSADDFVVGPAQGQMIQDNIV